MAQGGFELEMVLAETMMWNLGKGRREQTNKGNRVT